MAKRAGAVTLMAGIALVAAAGPAGANDGRDITSFGFSVSPSAVEPGGHVTLNANGCEEPSVRVSSAVFDDTVLNEGHARTVRVFEDARPGAEYTVTFRCKGERGTTTLTIRGHGGVHAGEGGTAAGVAGWTGTGSVLLAVGVLGGAYVVRRRKAGAS
ncbi:hypothetical protein [Streptomyces sp. NPDC089919]|uniref:hypothetical protein n=1 Tax=Streptomyces sp. NPDC089919 TaxID=3155188 RepID=UPI0034308A9F